MTEPESDTGQAVTEPGAPATTKAGTRPAALLISILALVVALATAVYSLLLPAEAPPPAPDTAPVLMVEANSAEIDALRARMDDLVNSRRRLEDDMSRLSGELRRESTELAALDQRLEALERQLRRLAGGDRTRSAWLLAEAEHYLRIANVQLGLASDVPVSLTALGLADDILRELNDPRFTPVRRLLGNEMAALDRVPRPDIEGIVLTLGSLADSLPTLPLDRTAPEHFRRQTGADTGDESTATARALAAVREAFSGLVQVRRTDQPAVPLLDEASQSSLVRSLEIELQLARLAIMRGDAGMYQRALGAATDRLARYFDQSNREVAATLATLQELGEIELPETLPDISRSLALLNEITTASEEAAQ